MFFKEITSHGALAPLTGCKLKSSYILKEQLPNNFYCLQSDLPFHPSELPWLTLVQLKSEAQQSEEVSELCMATLAFTTFLVLWTPQAAQLLLSGSTPGKVKRDTGIWNTAEAQQSECNCDSWSRKIMYKSLYSCKIQVFICMKQWPCHLTTNTFLNLL